MRLPHNSLDGQDGIYPLFLRGTKSKIHRHDLCASGSFLRGNKSRYKAVLSLLEMLKAFFRNNDGFSTRL